MRDRLRNIVEVEEDLLETPVGIKSRPHRCIPSEQVGGGDIRSGGESEWIIEATLLQSKGEAIVHAPCEFEGPLRDVLGLRLDSERNRAFFVSAVNALLRELKLVDRNLYCQDPDPPQCRMEIVRTILKRFGLVNVGLAGLKPSLVEPLVETFGVDRVRIVDPIEENVGTIHYGVEVWDTVGRTRELVKRSDVVLFTGSTLVNGTFDLIWEQIHSQGKEYIAYGNTILGIGMLMGVDGICPFAR